jgi:hypothetical protein
MIIFGLTRFGIDDMQYLSIERDLGQMILDSTSVGGLQKSDVTVIPSVTNMD